MKLKVFLIVCIGAGVMLWVSSIMIYTQLRAVQNVSLDPLTDSLYREDSKILTWILSSIPVEKIDTLKLPESWAEIFVVNNNDLKIVSSTNPGHRSIPLYRHGTLLDEASPITEAIKRHSPSMVSTTDYTVTIQPLGSDESIIALKSKAWEKGLVSGYERLLKEKTSHLTMILVIFLLIGACIALGVAFLIAKAVVTPTRNALDAFEALSLGDFDHDITSAKGKEMQQFLESYLRLKTSLELALERISRR